jgi:ABC-type uncharacterized transport system involved in gliding motility auxiliary subunit
MDALKKHLNEAAGIFLLVGLIGLIISPQERTAILVVFALGLAALAAHVALNWTAFKKGFTRRSFLYSGNLLLVVVIVLAILGLANYFLSKHNYRADFTAAKLHSLSDQSVTVLKALKADVSFKCFFREGNYGRAAMENLFKLYAYHSNHVKYEFIDPDKNPGLVKRYDVTQDGTSVLEAGDKESRITTTSEEDVTNALIKVTRAAKKVIYFLEGHGEAAIDATEERGYSTIKAELEKVGYEVKKQSLALPGRLPADCALLIVPGPQKDLLSAEYETIRSYINSGGRVLVLVDPQTPTLLPMFLSEFGFKLENDVIIDTDAVSRLMGGDYFIPIAREYVSHPITARFGYATFYPLARSIDVAESKPEGATLTALANTSEQSYAKVDFLLKEKMTTKDIAFTAGNDRRGPICLAVAGSFKFPAAPAAKPEAKPGESATPSTPRPEPKEARMAVIGDSDFAMNGYYGWGGNGNFFLNVANWLTEESDLISIQPKTQTPRTIQLTASQGRLVFLISIVLLPLAALVLGVAVWARRRSQ